MILKNKNYFRKKSLDVILNFSDNEKKTAASHLAKLFLKESDLNKYARIGLYAADATELSVNSLFSILKKRHKKFFFPKVDGPNMTFFQVKDLSELTLGKYGILEPSTNMKICKKLDLILIPGRAFDTQGTRIGRGAGYYDRYLSHYPDAYKVGVAFEQQIHKDLPHEQHDIKMNAILTNHFFFEIL